TVRLWDAATGQPVGEPLRGYTDQVLSVWFSPDGTHIVSGSQDETSAVEAFDNNRNSTPFVLNVDSGWVVGPKGRLLFWVPLASRHPFYSPGTSLVIPRGGTELDLSHMTHGRHWQKCREG
ncbi:hypothetical protein BDR04DRAFT_1022573, partial [Suillus decipiens]